MLLLGLLELLLIPAFIIVISYFLKFFGKRLQKNVQSSIKRTESKRKKAKVERKFLEKQISKETDNEVVETLTADLMSEFRNEFSSTVQVTMLKATSLLLAVITWVSRFVVWVTTLLSGSLVLATLGLSMSVLAVAVLMTSSGLGNTKAETTPTEVVEKPKDDGTVTAVGKEPDTVEERALLVAKLVKKYEPKATREGVTAMLANFWYESQITAKRAESDYLNPPIGATDSSWDDEAWLTIGEPQLYGGRFPNIKSRGLGLGQWTDTYDGAVRNTLLRDFAKKNNKKWYALDLQIQFMFEGDDPYYQNILRGIITSSGDPSHLTERFLAEWEGVPGNALYERLEYSNKAFELLKDFK